MMVGFVACMQAQCPPEISPAKVNASLAGSIDPACDRRSHLHAESTEANKEELQPIRLDRLAQNRF
jgi:hypothetical protein